MGRQIFLEENRSRSSVNASNTIGVDLDVKAKALQGSNMIANFSLFEQYNIERDQCNKYRMVFVVNPVCSNVLFNMQTEIVKDEGSDNVTVLNSTGINKNTIPGNCIQNESVITREHAIRDTEYSNPRNGNFDYHCGIDIFNNHMLRCNGFVHVNNMGKSFEKSKLVYNTIDDYLRDGEGVIVKNVTSPMDMTKKELHLYTADNSLTFKRAYQERIKEKDGWIGFYNPSNIDIPNSTGSSSAVTINRMLSNRKACEFIDMYPDRSLYSFVPKYNKFRKRAEKNWDYCITYPYRMDKNKIDDVFGGSNGCLRADVEEKINSSSISILECKSWMEHTFRSGDYINVYYKESEDGELKKYPVKVRVVSIGDSSNTNRNRVFSIRKSDVSGIAAYLVNGLFYKKIVGSAECEYYFRIYKKLEGKNGDLRSEVTKLAHGENIYGDRVAQVVFIDDIDIEGVYDHRGRPVSELYFTVIKRNAGNKLWYHDNDYSNSEVEFSHCFGQVTSGLDFGESSSSTIDYNVRRLHNVEGLMITEPTTKCLGDAVSRGVPKAIETDITINNDEFYGDVVEFDPINCNETEISPVYHRFNTMQRESIAPVFSKIRNDVLKHDDYDFIDETNTTFLTEEKNFASVKTDDGLKSIKGNIRPEGYFYNPHYKIKVRENAEQANTSRAKLINYASIESVFCLAATNNTLVTITVPTSYEFRKWDYLAFYCDGSKTNPENTQWGRITNIDGNKLELDFEGLPFGTNAEEVRNVLIGENREYLAYYSNETIPMYAKFNKSSQSFTWRGTKLPSEMAVADELYDAPFANGRFYIEKNFNIFLRRQDPFGDFGLSYALNAEERNPMEYFNVDSELLDISQIYNFYNKLDNVCY